MPVTGESALNSDARRLLVVAAVLLALATLIGALSAHVLKPRLSGAEFDVLQTAVHYQFFHALGLLGVGVLVQQQPLRTLRAAGWLLVIGIVLFSGSLYLLVAHAPRFVGVFTPIGGLCLIGGWCTAAAGLIRARAQRGP